MSNILDKIWNAVKDLLPFLSSAAEKTFDQLEENAKIAGINGSLFAQIIKENVEAAEADVKNLIKSKLNLSDETFNALFETLSEKYAIYPEDLIKYLQLEFKNRTDDILHSSFANEVASLVAIVLSKGKLTWLTLLMGVGEFIYRRYVKGVEVDLQRGDPTCIPPKIWNPILKKCVDDL